MINPATPSEIPLNPDILTPPVTIMHVISGDLWAGAEMQAFTLLRDLQPHYNLVVIALNDGELVKRLKQIGVNVHVVDESVHSSLAILLHIKKFIRRYNPSLIHTHRTKENILASFANCLSTFPFKRIPFKRIPSVRTVHGSPEYLGGVGTRLRNKLDTWVGNHLQDGVVAVSSELANKLNTHFPAEKITVIRNGLDTSSLGSVTPATDVIDESKIQIGIVGRLEPVKRVDIFVEMAYILTKFPNSDLYRFHVVGDGSLRESLQEHAERRDLKHLMRFHGHRSDSQSVIAALDAIVMCSDHEGTPMTALETLALHKPLIAHNVGGLKEVLEHYPQYLVKEHLPKAYAAAVIDALHAETDISLPEIYEQRANTLAITKLYRSLEV